MAKHEHGNKSRLTISIETELYERVKKVAEFEQTTTSGLIEECIAAHLPSKEPKTDLLDEIRTPPEDIQKVVKQLLSPAKIWEAMKIAGVKSPMSEEIENSKSSKGKKNKTLA